MAQYINDPVPKYRSDDLNKTTKDLHGYVVGLSDQLQYLLANLDEDNIPELDSIKKRLTDAEGNITNIKIAADGISASVQNNKGQIAKLEIRADKIASSVTDMEKGLRSQIEQTAEHIRTEVSDIQNGLSSQIVQTANEIRTQVNDNKGDISTIRQTANSLQTQISGAKGDISSIRQTANSLQSQISSANGAISTVQQTADSLVYSVSDLSGKYSRLEQTVDGFDFTGLVTFNDLDDYPTNRDLERGRTTIDGGCISTGEIDCEFIRLYGEMTVYEDSGGRYEGGYIGYCSGYSDNGIGFMESRRGGQCICTDGGARLTHGRSGNEMWVANNGCFSSEAMQIYSDRRVKEQIRYDLSDYETFFRALKPCTFLLRRRTSGRRHMGFIAQEISAALETAGLSSADCAAACFDVNAKRHDGTDETGLWSVRYAEMIALNTAMIQNLMARVDKLEAELAQLKAQQNN